MNYIAVHIDCQGEWQDILIAELSMLPFDTFEEHDNGISAYVPEDHFQESELKEILSRYSQEINSFRLEEIEKKNWNEEWEKNYDPVFIEEKVVVRAIFHPDMPEFKHQIVINPKMSFGTGHHSTTHLMIQNQLDIDHKAKDVADFGSGTGVLAIMAYQLGAKSIVATDVDDWCIENSRENFALNDISEVRVMQGPIGHLKLDSDFDIILANINKNVLLEEIEEYSRYLRFDGTLMLSGFYEKDVKDIREAAEIQGLKYVKSTTKNDWAALVFQKPR